MDRTKPTIIKTVAVAGLLAGIMGFTGCNAISYPPKRAVYQPACEAVKSAKDLPLGAVVDPRHNASVYIAKNAAQVELEYDYADSAGKPVTGTYLVYLKRINRRWVLDRCFPLPKDGSSLFRITVAVFACR